MVLLIWTAIAIINIAYARRPDPLLPGRTMFERFTDRARRVVVLAQDEARMLDAQLHRHRAHPARPHPRGRGRRGQGAHLDWASAWRRCGSRSRTSSAAASSRRIRAHPVHAAGQEGARAVAARGDAARSRLHRHRAHPARPDPRGRRRGRAVWPGLGADLNRARQQVVELLHGRTGAGAARAGPDDLRPTGEPHRRPADLDRASGWTAVERPGWRRGRSRGLGMPAHVRWLRREDTAQQAVVPALPQRADLGEARRPRASTWVASSVDSVPW